MMTIFGSLNKRNTDVITNEYFGVRENKIEIYGMEQSEVFSFFAGVKKRRVIRDLDQTICGDAEKTKLASEAHERENGEFGFRSGHC
ncbi:hypothetical protein JTE90_004795 [Oedothorax gibbosus]|uniref:Uncharacterized protein n=1 Tax=Oedothorax gibbosus TaxID=931172 RepID=A0AAV6VJJ1_9ARAC|nr:hypothetical protein JTE90_004795 [Oedothorax gibbosus]